MIGEGGYGNCRIIGPCEATAYLASTCRASLSHHFRTSVLKKKKERKEEKKRRRDFGKLKNDGGTMHLEEDAF